MQGYHPLRPRSAGLSLAEALPDETTILNFRHLLERHERKGLLDEINAHLESQGLRLREGSQGPPTARNFKQRIRRWVGLAV